MLDKQILCLLLRFFFNNYIFGGWLKVSWNLKVRYWSQSFIRYWTFLELNSLYWLWHQITLQILLKIWAFLSCISVEKRVWMAGGKLVGLANWWFHQLALVTPWEPIFQLWLSIFSILGHLYRYSLKNITGTMLNSWFNLY